MGIDFTWEGNELQISQCKKMRTSPDRCGGCRSRFKCFTNRTAEINAMVSSADTPNLAKLIQAMEQFED